MKKNFKETSNRGAVAWLWQRISAVVLFVLLLVHFVTYHFIAQGVIRYEDIVAKMQASWFNLVQILFLLTALYHGFNGIWMVIEDYVHHRIWRIVLFSAILTAGITFFVLGTLTVVKAGNILAGVKE